MIALSISAELAVVGVVVWLLVLGFALCLCRMAASCDPEFEDHANRERVGR